ncbi:MAG TPA: LysM peptidoglycan-binding domain-containing protein [Candidatus Limnocylindrales bacterium]|nr:LysM peptidoglycan-binding domain-containing protein [Candidatus Limnocylindrales bacterium]
MPAPRTVAHQERYCLSPNFSGCPVFQAWAVRAAARPVPIPGGVSASTRSLEPAHEVETVRSAGTGGEGSAAPAAQPDEPDVVPAADPLAPIPPVLPRPPVVAVGSDGSGLDEPPVPEGPLPAHDEMWPDSMGAPIVPETGALGVPTPSRASGEADMPIQTDTTWSAAVSGRPPAAQEQLSVFDAPMAPIRSPSVDPEAPAPTFASTLPDESFAPLAVASSAEPPHASPDYDNVEDEAPTVPAFLTGRSARPRPPVSGDHLDRGDLVPSWDLDGRFGGEPGPGQTTRADGGGMGTVLTTVAVIAIIGLGILAVLLIPGVLGGNGSQPTRRPTNLPTISTTAQATTVAVLPTAAGEPTPADVQPTPEPTPEATPIFYTIKRNDTLARVARRNGTTVDDILAANPQIPGANAIQVGQVIVLPPPTE